MLDVRQTKSDLEVRLLSSLADIEQIELQWRELSDCQNDPMTYFQSYDWCRSWLLSCSATERDNLQVYTAWREDRLVGLIPFTIIKKFGVSRLVPLGSPHTQYAGCLLADECFDRDFLDYLINYIKTSSNVDCIAIDDLPMRSIFADALVALGHTFNPGETSQVLDLESFNTPQEFVSSVSKNKRKYRMRRLRKLSERGDVKLTPLSGGTQGYKDIVQTALAWKQDWLTTRGQPMANDKKERLLNLLSNLSGSGMDEGSTVEGALALKLSVDGVPVAVEIGFVQHGHYYSYLGAFDPAWDNLSPGKVQIFLAKQWAIEQGLKAFDFMGGGGDYKAHNANKEVKLVSVCVPSTWMGHLFCRFWLTGLRPNLHSIFKQSSPHLKAFLVRGKALFEGGSNNLPEKLDGKP